MSRPETSQNQQGLTSRKELVSRLCANYELDPTNESDRATMWNAVLYHSTMARALEVAHTRALMLEAGGEFKDGTAATALGIGADLLGAVPVLGNAISAVGKVAQRGAKEIQMQPIEEEFKGISNLGGLDAHARRDVASVCAIARIGDLRSLSEKEARKLAQEDCQRGLNAIKEKQIPGSILMPRTVLTLAQVATGLQTREQGAEKSPAAQVREAKEKFNAMKKLAQVMDDKPATTPSHTRAEQLSHHQQGRGV